MARVNTSQPPADVERDEHRNGTRDMGHLSRPLLAAMYLDIGIGRD